MTPDPPSSVRARLPDASPDPRAAARRVADALAGRPWIARAVRTTGAAVLAWLAVGLVPGPWSEYPYYAPLGAVVATSVTVRGSTLQSAQAVLAIALGAVVARAVDSLPLAQLPALAVVVLVGVLLSGWRVLGDLGSWVPTSALFVLVIGAADPVGYVSAYVGLTLLGAMIGVGVNALAPPLPLTPAERALDTLQAEVAGHLEALAHAVRDDAPVPAGGGVRTARAHAASAAAEARDAARANWTARHYRSWRERQDRHALSLDRAAGVALDVTRTLETAATLDAVPDASRPLATSDGDPEVRAAVADAVAAGAAVVRALRHDGTDDDPAARLAGALDDAGDAVAAARARAGGTTLPADAVVVALTPLLTG
ncbi:FUSC family protein [Cellulomonas hominis]|uniref:FUSC family protein n=1 Tax=Cellulomonas hominis TaxID=156981 RepID=UPI001BCDE147|nr:hypothetical protein [Cellulomonas hominis]